MKWPVLEENSRGELVPMKFCRENVEYLLTRLGVSVRFNQMTKKVDFTGLNKISFDAAAAALRQEARRRGLMIGKQDFIDLLGLIAELNQYSPVCDYLKQCRQEWDRKEIYIDQLFQALELDETSNQDPEFCKKLLTIWLITAVRVAFNDGTFAAQGMLILEGSQGIGKTRLKYILLPNESWANEMSMDPTVKDDLLKVAHYWIVELGEFRDTMRYQRIDRLKQFITQAKDAIRLPYTRETIEYPRKTVFMGTVNGENFLYDHSGNRRYWPIAVSAIHLTNAFPKNQLWGQVMHLAFDKKERAWLTREEIEQLNKQNEAYERKSIAEQLILDGLAWGDPVEKWRKVTATELCFELNIDRAQNARIGRILQGMAKKDRRIQCPTNNREREYFLPEKKPLPFVFPKTLPDDE